MTLPDTAVRTAVYAALSASALPGGAKVYDSLAPDMATGTYVILGPQRSEPESTKNAFGCQHRFQLSAVERVGPGTGGRKGAETLLNAVLQRLTPQEPGGAEPIQPQGWDCWLTRVEAGPDLPLTTASGTIHQKLVTLIFHLTQTN